MSGASVNPNTGEADLSPRQNIEHVSNGRVFTPYPHEGSDPLTKSLRSGSYFPAGKAMV